MNNENQKQNTVGAQKQATKTDDFIKKYHESTEDIFAKANQLDKLVSRLDGVANRLNGIGYFKNQPQEVSNMLKSTPIDRIEVNGIMGEYRVIIDSQNDISIRMRNIIDEIDASLNYIEEHI